MGDFEQWARGVYNQSIGQCWLTGNITESEAIGIATQTFCPDRCGSCRDCLIFQSNEHPDLKLLTAQDGHTIKLDQVRSVLAAVTKRPISRHHIVIITDAHMLTEASYHCLLKSLEDSVTTWYLLCTPYMNMIPKTIRSRCQKLFYHQNSKFDSYQVWLESLSIHYTNCYDQWVENKYTVDAVIAYMMQWLRDQYLKSQCDNKWLSTFDEVVNLGNQYKSKSSLSESIVLERLALMASRLQKLS